MNQKIIQELYEKYFKRVDDQEWVFTNGHHVSSPNPNVESYEEFHLFKTQKRVLYEKYEIGWMPEDVTYDTPDIRRFIQSPDRELVKTHYPFIKIIFDCDPKDKKGKYILTIIEFLSYKKIELSSTPMRKMIQILADAKGYVKTDILVKKTGFKNRDNLMASKRRLNAQIRKGFRINQDFLNGNHGDGYRISESFLVLKKQR